MGSCDKIAIALLDDSATLTALKTYLELLNFNVVAISDFKSFFVNYRQIKCNVDLLIVDDRINKCDKIEEIIEYLRSKAGSFPVIFIGGDAQIRSAERSSAAGLYRLGKPISPKRLFDIVGLRFSRT